LTILPPLVRRAFTPEELGRAVGFFPLIGVGIGAILIGIDRLALLLWPSGIATSLVLIAWVLITGGLHLDGFLDACDGLFGGRTVADRLRIMRDERVGAYAVIGGLLLLLLKFQALAAFTDTTVPLLLAPLLGRWAMALAIIAFPYARSEGLGRNMKDYAGRWQAALATLTVGGVLACCGGVREIMAVPVAALATFLVARFAIARVSGLTGDVYGAICEVVEVVVLLALAAGGTA
jgi:adenosylcobinamide-GDP ribazoletransferase